MIYEFSNRGTYHVQKDEENQDVLCYKKSERYNVITLADGATDSKEAKMGAEIACNAVTDLFLDRAGYFFSYQKEEIAELALGHVLFEIEDYAKKQHVATEEYASTLTSVVWDRKKEKGLLFGLGDGIVLGKKFDQWYILVMPNVSENGCYVTTTKHVEKEITARKLDLEEYDAIVICSDGAWKSMFHRGNLKPEIIRWMNEGEYERIEEYLKSMDISDDYSLIAMDLTDEERRDCA